MPSCRNDEKNDNETTFDIYVLLHLYHRIDYYFKVHQIKTDLFRLFPRSLLFLLLPASQCFHIMEEHYVMDSISHCP